MRVNINGSMNIRNGSININTSPIIAASTTTTTTTSTTTTTTTFNADNYACVVVGGDEPGELNGTYVVTGTSTVDGVTRSIYTNTNGFGATMELTSAIGGPVWAFFLGGSLFNSSTSQPAPTYAWQATGYGIDLRSLSRGPC